MDTKITRLRNLMSPICNYFSILKNKENSDKTARFLDKNEKQAILDIDEIKNILREIPNDACENKNEFSSQDMINFISWLDGKYCTQHKEMNYILEQFKKQNDGITI